MEKDYTSQGFIVSLIIHCSLLLLCLLIIIRTPIPPFPQGSGVELNYGTVDEGYGNIQTRNQANASQVKEEAAPPKKQEVEEKPVLAQEIKEEVEERKPEIENPNKIAEEKMITSEDEESEKITNKIAEKQKKVSAPPVVAQKKVEKKVEVVDHRAVFGSGGKSNGTTGTKEQIAGNSNGDRPGTVGDQGNPQGSLDAKALYGNPGTGGNGPGGSGGGTALDMVGWAWDSKPVINDQSSESGRIVFQIKVDEDGDIVSVIAIEKSVSPTLVDLYKREVQKLTFSKTSKGAAPSMSSGRITFIIKSR